MKISLARSTLFPDGRDFVANRVTNEAYGELTKLPINSTEVVDSDGDDFAVLPEWIADDKIAEVVEMLAVQRAKGEAAGRRAGGIEEHAKILYGFRAILAPVIDAVMESSPR